MSNTATIYWIQANEDGLPKNVPHTGKTKYKFLFRDAAKDFLKKLRKNNPDTKFRLVTCQEIYGFGSWDK